MYAQRTFDTAKLSAIATQYRRLYGEANTRTSVPTWKKRPQTPDTFTCWFYDYRKNYVFPPRLQWLQELPETTLHILYVQNTIPISWTGLESQVCLVRDRKLRFTATVRRAFHQAQYFLFPVCMWQAGIWSLQKNRQHRLVNGLASLNSSSSRKSSYVTLFGSLSGNFRRANWLGLFNVSFNYSNYTLHRLG